MAKRMLKKEVSLNQWLITAKIIISSKKESRRVVSCLRKEAPWHSSRRLKRMPSKMVMVRLRTRLRKLKKLIRNSEQISLLERGQTD